MRKANIRWSWEHGDVKPAALKAPYAATGFTFIEPVGDDRFANLFGPGVFGLFAFSADTLIGAARAFGDDLTTTWLAEICVDPGWRRQGVGRALLERIDTRFRRTALYCDAFAETVDFFKAKGIRHKRKLIACRRLPDGGKVERRNVPHIVVRDDPSRYGPADFDDVADSIGFGISDRGIPRDRLYRKFFGDGVFSSFAESRDGRLIGFLRGFSDDLTKSYVAEICVHPEWQRKGIGRALLGRTAHRFSHTIIHTETFPEAVRLFETLGITPAPGLVGCSRAPLDH